MLLYNKSNKLMKKETTLKRHTHTHVDHLVCKRAKELMQRSHKQEKTNTLLWTCFPTTVRLIIHFEYCIYKILYIYYICFFALPLAFTTSCSYAECWWVPAHVLLSFCSGRPAPHRLRCVHWLLYGTIMRTWIKNTKEEEELAHDAGWSVKIKGWEAHTFLEDGVVEVWHLAFVDGRIWNRRAIGRHTIFLRHCSSIANWALAALWMFL